MGSIWWAGRVLEKGGRGLAAAYAGRSLQVSTLDLWLLGPAVLGAASSTSHLLPVLLSVSIHADSGSPAHHVTCARSSPASGQRAKTHTHLHAHPLLEQSHCSVIGGEPHMVQG